MITFTCRPSATTDVPRFDIRINQPAGRIPIHVRFLRFLVCAVRFLALGPVERLHDAAEARWSRRVRGYAVTCSRTRTWDHFEWWKSSTSRTGWVLPDSPEPISSHHPVGR